MSTTVSPVSVALVYMDCSALDHTNHKVLPGAEGGHPRYHTPSAETLTTRTRDHGNPENPIYHVILVEHLRPIWKLKDLENFKKAFREIMLGEFFNCIIESLLV